MMNQSKESVLGYDITTKTCEDCVTRSWDGLTGMGMAAICLRESALP